MKEKKLIIQNKLGLHARPAAMLVELTAKYNAEITIIKDNNEVDGKSIMGLMTLAAGIGTEIIVKVDGNDEDELLLEVEKLIAGKFEEE